MQRLIAVAVKSNILNQNNTCYREFELNFVSNLNENQSDYPDAIKTHF